jgi:cell division protein DivIC
MSRYPNPLEPLLDLLPAPLRNRYIAAICIFFTWMLLFDHANLRTQYQLSSAVERLEGDKAYYQTEIEKARQDKIDLEQNKEKFAREKYFMKKRDEDVFIFVTE